jgi:hypothetical protein
MQHAAYVQGMTVLTNILSEFSKHKEALGAGGLGMKIITLLMLNKYLMTVGNGLIWPRAGQ